MSLEPWRITSEVNHILGDPNNELSVSAVSVWEMVLLLEKKRIKLGENLQAWVANSQRDLSLREIPLSWEVALDLPFSPLVHQDPADRLLVATARVFDLILVTSDRRILGTKDVRVLANA